MGTSLNCRLAFLMAAASSRVPAYRPPVDTAGPLTVKIEGPQEITDPAKPASSSNGRAPREVVYECPSRGIRSAGCPRVRAARRRVRAGSETRRD